VLAGAQPHRTAVPFTLTMSMESPTLS
jgi:hypothetical protein